MRSWFTTYSIGTMDYLETVARLHPTNYLLEAFSILLLDFRQVWMKDVDGFTLASKLWMTGERMEINKIAGKYLNYTITYQAIKNEFSMQRTSTHSHQIFKAIKWFTWWILHNIMNTITESFQQLVRAHSTFTIIFIYGFWYVACKNIFLINMLLTCVYLIMLITP